MSLPRLIAQALSTDPIWAAPKITAFDSGCQGSRHHSPTPLLLHEVTLPGGRTVMLCGICEDNLAVLVHLMDSSETALPWPLLREFGNEIRALAKKEHASV